MPAVKKIRCALMHDHVLLRQGLRRLLEDADDMEVVAEAGNAAEALQSAYEHHPDVVIGDAGIFGSDALRVERLIQQESPRSKVLFLTMGESDAGHDEQQAACPVRQTSAQELVETVRKVHGLGIAPRELPAGGRDHWPGESALPRRRNLTTREQEVLKLLAEGMTVRSAAGVLGLSVKTVDAHKFNLMRKLGVHNKAELVMWAIQKRVVKLPAGL